MSPQAWATADPAPRRLVLISRSRASLWRYSVSDLRCQRRRLALSNGGLTRQRTGSGDASLGCLAAINPAARCASVICCCAGTTRSEHQGRWPGVAGVCGGSLRNGGVSLYIDYITAVSDCWCGTVKSQRGARHTWKRTNNGLHTTSSTSKW